MTSWKRGRGSCGPYGNGGDSRHLLCFSARLDLTYSNYDVAPCPWWQAKPWQIRFQDRNLRVSQGRISNSYKM